MGHGAANEVANLESRSAGGFTVRCIAIANPAGALYLARARA